MGTVSKVHRPRPSNLWPPILHLRIRSDFICREKMRSGLITPDAHPTARNRCKVVKGFRPGWHRWSPIEGRWRQANWRELRCVMKSQKARREFCIDIRRELGPQREPREHRWFTRSRTACCLVDGGGELPAWLAVQAELWDSQRQKGPANYAPSIEVIAKRLKECFSLDFGPLFSRHPPLMNMAAGRSHFVLFKPWTPPSESAGLILLWTGALHIIWWNRIQW